MVFNLRYFGSFDDAGYMEPIIEKKELLNAVGMADFTVDSIIWGV
jgi:hypothetical protein